MAVTIKNVTKSNFFGRSFRDEDKFSLIPSFRTTVSKIKVWVGKGHNCAGATILRGISLEWFGMSTGLEQYTKPRDGDIESEYNFAEDEVIVSMTIYSGHRVDKIEFETNKGGKFSKGGPGGDKHERIGNGYLIGIKGFSGGEIDGIQVLFASREAIENF